MSLEQILRNEVKEAKRWVDTGEGVYKRDLLKKIELINWALQRIKNPNICEVIESKMNEIIEKINKKDSMIEKDPLDRELRILDWILFQVCSQPNKLV